MQWTEAANKSRYHLAFRIQKKGQTHLKRANGQEYIINPNGGVVTRDKNSKSQASRFEDWEPIGLKHSEFLTALNSVLKINAAERREEFEEAIKIRHNIIGLATKLRNSLNHDERTD